MGKSMQHWNGRQLCAIDTETTGLDPFWHEIVQICILPLDANSLPRKDIPPFYINLIPENPERLEKEAFKKNKLKIDDLVNKGFDRIAAIDMLGDWITKLGLPVTAYGTPKTIIPLGHNYSFDRVFMIKWLGNDLYDTYFHYHFRDTMIAANYINDAAATHAEDVPFSKVGLQWLCNKLDVQSEKAHDALSDCLSTANVYRSLLKKGLIC